MWSNHRFKSWREADEKYPNNDTFYDLNFEAKNIKGRKIGHVEMSRRLIHKASLRS
jgi:hypothetical protein